jgi:hypothetical protein
MKEESKIVELLAELLKRADRQDEIRSIHSALLEKQGLLMEKQGKVLVKMLHAQNKTNLTLGELRLSNMRIAEALEHFADHENRIKKLENIVLKQAG